MNCKDINKILADSFAHFGVPAISFARYVPAGVPPIHTRYDTAAVSSAKQLLNYIILNFYYTCSRIRKKFYSICSILIANNHTFTKTAKEVQNNSKQWQVFLRKMRYNYIREIMYDEN